jgi:phosphatidate cytidylyltransferase
MNVQQTVLNLLGGLGALLVVASLIGWVLGRRASTPGGIETVRNLNARIKAWWVMVAVFAVAFLAGPMVTVALFAIASALALREFAQAVNWQPIRKRLMVVGLGFVIPVQYVLIAIEWYGMFAIFVPVHAFLIMTALAAVQEDVDGFLPRIATLHLGLMLCVYALSHAPALMLLKIPDYSAANIAVNALLLFYLLLVVQISDVLQYVFGKLFGKRKIAPVVSPSKTVEGFVGGGLAATAIGAALHGITPFTFWQAALLSGLIVICGFMGGLAMSAIKRSVGAKDWGTMISGHGGVLDRLDSVIFAAPAFFHAVHHFFVPGRI